LEGFSVDPFRPDSCVTHYIPAPILASEMSGWRSRRIGRLK
jgi:hypothetical protein